MEDKDKQAEKKWYILDRGSLSLLIVLLAAILFYVGLTNFDVIAVRVRTFMGVLTPFIAGFAIAYLLNTPMCFFERKLYQKQKHRRGLAILTVYLIALAIVVVLLNLIIPQVAQSVVDLATNMQTYLTSLNSLVQTLSEQFGLEAEALNEAIGSYQDLMTNIAAYLSKALPDLLNFGYAIGSGVISGITALISSVYMLAGKGRLVPQIKKMLYAILPRRRADWLLGVCGHANRVFVGFINGKLIDSAIIGVLCFILCLIFRIPYPMLVSVVVGVTNIIPFFGPIIGAIPCLMILVIVDPWAALRFFALVIGLYDGFIGPGTGTFLIIAFAMLGFDFVVAAGNAKILNLVSNITAFVLFIISGKVLYVYGLVMALGIFLGAFFGSRMAIRHGSGFVRFVMMAVTTVLIGKLLLEYIGVI